MGPAGSKVIRGNVLAIPVNNTLFYVEPIYLQAETAAYPELRLVVVMHGENMSYAKTFDEALSGLFTKATTPIAQNMNKEEQKTNNGNPDRSDHVKSANAAFNNYLKSLGEKKFNDAGKELEKLQQELQILSNQSSKKP